MNVKCLIYVIGVLNLSFVFRKGVYIDNPSKIWLLEPLSGSPTATGCFQTIPENPAECLLTVVILLLTIVT